MNTRILVTMLSIGFCGLHAVTVAGEAPPDSDGDGVSDVSDQCVNEPGHVDSPVGRGCPCTIGVDTPDSDCDNISDYIDGDLDYGDGDYDGSGGTDTDGDGISDDNDDSPYGEGNGSEGNGDEGTGGGGGNGGTGGHNGSGTGTTGGGTGTGTVVDPWRQTCNESGGVWVPDADWWRESGWCTYEGEVRGVCWVHVSQMPDDYRARYNITRPGPFEHPFPDHVRDRCRHYRGHWYPYE